MAIPLLLSGAIVVFARRHLQDASLLRGLWLIPIAVAGTVVSGAVHRMTDLDDALVNRSLSALVLAGCILFVVVNRHTVTGLVRLGVLMTTIGAGLNALATRRPRHRLPPDVALRHRSRLADVRRAPRRRHPDPGAQRHHQHRGRLLVPGCSILLAACVAPLFLEDDDPEATTPGSSHRAL